MQQYVIFNALKVYCIPKEEEVRAPIRSNQRLYNWYLLLLR